jgi:RNA polymerase sigma factor (sigma-70 family)
LAVRDRAQRGARRAAAPQAPDVDEAVELALQRETVRAALSALDGRERDLLALKFSGGLSNAEIARVLGVSETAAGTRLHRTLTKLRKACDE